MPTIEREMSQRNGSRAKAPDLGKWQAWSQSMALAGSVTTATHFIPAQLDERQQVFSVPEQLALLPFLFLGSLDFGYDELSLGEDRYRAVHFLVSETQSIEPNEHTVGARDQYSRLTDQTSDSSLPQSRSRFDPLSNLVKFVLCDHAGLVSDCESPCDVEKRGVTDALRDARA